ncbi:redox-regulated ATPase YchF [Oceanidesulfovibrio indonesiensis]|uniref:Ribosome-binding ATPase YchF n=1 Tax=Oceanidesulfovibrio indonesiensis TaxID=54767 RepID=A0A7M3MEJ4_9BACT|nr:redox-regulated ATPase YchF [Oceanidesulfovibrio indonesiensis]TVM16873.1 redox-regulated ATPase YchF [Oceanidesulfovibrio indonesiensis]
MALDIGIVGLPNVGKSTLFNALTKAQNAEAANYPFCTIEPNKAVVPVPDARVDALEKLLKPAKTIYATVNFVDIAGLVRGASKGEGLGNKFLANIRESTAILHVVRCFEDGDVAHVDGSVDPIRDIETIETELLLADLQAVENKLERTRKQRGDKKAATLADQLQVLRDHIAGGEPVATYTPPNEDMAKQLRELALLTAKPVIYCANVDEGGLTEEPELVTRVREHAETRGAEVVRICARMEEELLGLTEEEQAEYLTEYGVTAGGLEQVIRTGYKTLGLISFLTAGPKEVRAWTVTRGARAPQAAGVIHTDFERGFIRAEVISFEDYIKYGSEAACRSAGVLRVEGKDYVVQDGDVVHFLFNV